MKIHGYRMDGLTSLHRGGDRLGRVCKTLKRVVLAAGVAGIAAALTGCLSVHTSKNVKEVEHPVVVPDQPPPPPIH